MMVIGIDPSFTGCGISDGVRHEIISTKPRDGEDHFAGLQRRCNELLDRIVAFVGKESVAHLFIEAPMMAMPAHGGSHLFDLGWLMNDLVNCLPCELLVGSSIAFVLMLAV